MFAFLDLFQYVSCKTQTPHKPAKSPTNHPNHPQIRNCILVQNLHLCKY